jgi:hypothetical protein
MMGKTREDHKFNELTGAEVCSAEATLQTHPTKTTSEKESMEPDESEFSKLDRAARYMEEAHPEIWMELVLSDKLNLATEDAARPVVGQQDFASLFRRKEDALRFIEAVRLHSPTNAIDVARELVKHVKKFYLGPERHFSDAEIASAAEALKMVPNLWDKIKRVGAAWSDEDGIADEQYEISMLSDSALAQISWLTPREKLHKRYSSLLRAVNRIALTEDAANKSEK